MISNFDSKTVLQINFDGTKQKNTENCVVLSGDTIWVPEMSHLRIQCRPVYVMRFRRIVYIVALIRTNDFEKGQKKK